ncbi:tetratricopeptide repeat protein [Streptomyces sp. NPDC001709]
MRTLKKLIYEAYVAAGAPALDAMAKAIAAEDELTAGPARDTISRMIGDPTAPADQADVVALVTALTRMVGGDGQQAGREAAALWTQVQLAEPLGRPVSDIDPYDLEVHHAITLRGAAGLPTYVERGHDIELRRIVAEAIEGNSRLVMLVGTSSSGKTRACFEAIRQLPDGWRLWHPIDPDRRQAALAGLHRVGPKTVVWLNEAHHYLLDPQHGEPISAGLRTLLADSTRAPVLILGTIWPGPGYFDDLRETPQPGGMDPDGPPRRPPGHKDPYGQARVLLAGRDLHVPTAFTPSQIEEISTSKDPRLVTAARAAHDGMVTQYLAAGFELVAIHSEASPGPRALLDAAIDARRLGHPLGLPLPFLATAAEAYLTDTEWDLLPEDWLEQALTQLTRPVKGARGPLHRQRRPRGSVGSPSAASGQTYRLADFLVDHFRAARRALPVPPLFWEAAVWRCEGEAARDLASAAAARGLTETACRLWAKAGEHRKIAQSLIDSGRLNEAIPWLEQAHRAGDTQAAPLAAKELARAGRLDEVPQWYELSPEIDSAQANWRIAETLAEAGRIDAALPWFERAAAGGDTDSLLAAAEALADNGRLTEALSWFQRAAASGDTDAYASAAQRLSDAGRLDEARSWVERAEEAGLAGGLRPAAEGVARADEAEDAPVQASRGATAGSVDISPANDDRPTPIRRLGEVSEWAARAAARAEAQPLAALRRLADAGEVDKALALAEEAAAAGDAGALMWGAQRLADGGRWAEAFAWCRRAVAAGSELAAHLAVISLHELGRTAEAEQLDRYGWNTRGDIAAAWRLD